MPRNVMPKRLQCPIPFCDGTFGSKGGLTQHLIQVHPSSGSDSEESEPSDELNAIPVERNAEWNFDFPENSPGGAVLLEGALEDSIRIFTKAYH